MRSTPISSAANKADVLILRCCGGITPELRIGVDDETSSEPCTNRMVAEVV